MYTSEFLHTVTVGQPTEAAKLASALISLVVSAGLLWSIFVIEKRSSLTEYVTDKKHPQPEPEQEQEQEQEQEGDVLPEEVEPEDIPVQDALTVRRMCDIGCCPRGEKFDAYYSRFSYGELVERCNEAMDKCAEIEDVYVRAREVLRVAKEDFDAVSSAYTHILTSSEKLRDLTEMRRMHSQLQGHSKEDMFAMLSAVHQWKSFAYAPDGMYPYQKDLWEKVLLKEIYARA
jgi:hypothetical protein